MPISVTLSDAHYTMIHPTVKWQTIPLHLTNTKTFRVDENYYIDTKRIE